MRTGCFSYIHIEHARVAGVAALAEEHVELGVENCVALGVSECIFAASRALAQDRHRLGCRIFLLTASSSPFRSRKHAGQQQQQSR